MARIKQTLQENLLTILCFSETNCKIVRNLVPANKYDGDLRTIASYAIDYIDAYGKPPASHLPDLLEKELTGDEDAAASIKNLLTSLYSTKDDINEKFILNRLSTFITIQSMREGIITAAQHLQDETEDSIEQAELIFSKLRKEKVSAFDPGIFLGTPESLKFHSQPVEAFHVDIPSLDLRKLGPTRKELHVFMGLMNQGKSWWLIHIGKTCLRQRIKVCHITLEMSIEQVFQRYYQSLFAFTKRQVDSIVAKWDTDDLGRISSLKTEKYSAKGSFDDPKTDKLLLNMTKKWGPRFSKYLVVKEFPTGKLTPQGLTAYLDLLYEEHNFAPDIVLLDYADLMAIDTTRYRLELGNIYKTLRGIAVERNLAMVTVSQSNREGVGRTKLTAANIGEDFSKLQTCDVAISYNQTEQEAKRSLARLNVLKARNDDVGIDILIAQNYAAGQFCLRSHQLSGKKYWEEIDRELSPGETKA